MPPDKTSQLCDPAKMTEKLGYITVERPRTTPSNPNPFWTQPEHKGIEELAQRIDEQAWKVAFIRRQMRKLGLKPSGRRRVDLARQWIEGFLDADRVTQALATLSDDERQRYLWTLLFMNLESLRTEPQLPKSLATSRQDYADFRKRMIECGLLIEEESGGISCPDYLPALLPPDALDYPAEIPEPSTYIPAADPQGLSIKIQQFLSLLQAKTYTLRPDRRWSMPAYNYGNRSGAWPPTPRSARQLINAPYAKTILDLCPPEPYPDEAALADWSTTLDLSPEAAEFLYHVLVTSDIVGGGTPITVNMDLAHRWLLNPPGEQLVAFYLLYRNLGTWGAWTPRWRTGQIKVQCNYTNYWSLQNIDREILTTSYTMRWVVLDVLSYLPQETWLSVHQVMDLLTDLFSGQNTHKYHHNLYFMDNIRETWIDFLRLVFKTILTGPLNMMGLIDVGPDLAKPTAFRMHHLQDLHWRRIQSLPLNKGAALTQDRVQLVEDDVLQIAPPANPAFLSALQKWAQPAGLADGQLRYRCDVDRLHKAFEHGETPETLTDAWEDTADFAPLPKVAAWWQRWWDAYGHVRLYPAQTALMTRDDFTMQEVQVALPNLSEAILGMVTPRVALLQPEQVDQIKDDLERQGYMPKET